jgi:integrase
MPWSDIALRNAKPGPKLQKLSDGGGLQLWIFPDGAKRWRLAYRFGGKQKLLALGVYPHVCLKEARQARDDAKRLLTAGTDPSAKQGPEKSHSALEPVDTFRTIAEELLDKKRREERSAATLEKTGWLFSLAYPALADRPVAELTGPEILAVLKGVEARGRLETARRLRALIGEVFRYAIATHRAESDPTFALRGALSAPKVKHRAAITTPREFGGLLRAIDGYEGTYEVRIALQMLALTFVRPGELRFARWVEFDLEKAVWTIPPERMKMRRPHRVPLASQTLDLLANLRALNNRGPLLFPSPRDPERAMSENTFNAAIRRMDFSKDEMSSHGFRAAASSLLNESGKWNADAIEAQLAHVEGNDVRRAYARAEYWDERVRMMAWWGEEIERLNRPPERQSF